MRFVLAALGLASMTLAANAQALCGPRVTVTDSLKASHGETVAFTAMAQTLIFEFYLNPATGTWTAVFVTSEGLACVQAVGTNFKPSAPEKGDPS